MVDDIKTVLALLPSLQLAATSQVHKYSGLLKTLTLKGRHIFVDGRLLILEVEAFNNAGGYPVPFHVRIKCGKDWQSAYPGMMQMKPLSI